MIPNECYLYPTGYDQIANENAGVKGNDYLIDIKEGVKQGYFKAEPSADGNSTIYTLIPNNGLWLPVKGAMFPVKSFPEPNAIFAANLVKAHIIETVKIISRWYLIPFLFFIDKQQGIDAFNRISMKAMSAQLLKDNCLTDFNRELRVLIYTFLTSMGFTEKSSDTFATIFVHLIEFDNVYRLRLADTFSETDKNKLNNPQRELKRLLGIMKSREVRPGGKGEAIHYKFDRFAFIIRIALLLPKVKQAYYKTLKAVDIEKLKLDTNDTYWVCFRSDYKFMGLDDEERKDYAKGKGWVYPEPVDVR